MGVDMDMDRSIELSDSERPSSNAGQHDDNQPAHASMDLDPPAHVSASRKRTEQMRHSGPHDTAPSGGDSASSSPPPPSAKKLKLVVNDEPRRSTRPQLKVSESLPASGRKENTGQGTKKSKFNRQSQNKKPIVVLRMKTEALKYNPEKLDAEYSDEPTSPPTSMEKRRGTTEPPSGKTRAVKYVFSLPELFDDTVCVSR